MTSDHEPIAGAAGTMPAAVPGTGPDSDGPMTPKQAAILRDLADRAGEPFDGNLSRRQADERIEYLKARV